MLQSFEAARQVPHVHNFLGGRRIPNRSVQGHTRTNDTDSVQLKLVLEIPGLDLAPLRSLYLQQLIVLQVLRLFACLQQIFGGKLDLLEIGLA